MAEPQSLQLHDDDILRYVAPTPEALHAAVREVYALAKDRVLMTDPTRTDGETGEIVDRRYAVLFVELRETRRARQNRFYFGPVLRQIAEQAPGGWTTDAWHEAFKRTVLGYEIEVARVAGKKRPVTYRRLRSTTKRSVQQMSEYIDEIIATATTDLGVVFQLDPVEREAVRYRQKKRAAKAIAEPEQEAVPA